uniref:Uncharacterized protein n=1 Tax=Bionectria ochroleuca TaxID=29856 RepID=A0A8H7TIG2_BIOOC
MAPRTDFPRIRACLFDMDGLLLDTEDIYTKCTNIILERYGKSNLPWPIKARLQGRPGPAATKIFFDWADLPIDQDEYTRQNTILQAQEFPNTRPLPGVADLLASLGRTRYYNLKEGEDPTKRVHIALATSSHEANFRVKTNHLTDLFSVFPTHRRVLGDDTRLQAGRGKPLPDIFLLALKTINDSLPAGEEPIKPEECLVFEDSVPGVEAGRRAGMRVIWCPHPELKKVYAGREGRSSPAAWARLGRSTCTRSASWTTAGPSTSRRLRTFPTPSLASRFPLPLSRRRTS